MLNDLGYKLDDSVKTVVIRLCRHSAGREVETVEILESWESASPMMRCDFG